MCCLKLWIKSPYLKIYIKTKRKILKDLKPPIGEGRLDETMNFTVLIILISKAQVVPAS